MVIANILVFPSQPSNQIQTPSPTILTAASALQPSRSMTDAKKTPVFHQLCTQDSMIWCGREMISSSGRKLPQTQQSYNSWFRPNPSLNIYNSHQAPTLQPSKSITNPKRIPIFRHENAEKSDAGKNTRVSYLSLPDHDSRGSHVPPKHGTDYVSRRST